MKPKPYKINHQIHATEVRVIQSDGSSEILTLKVALDKALKNNEDLIQINSECNPPICKIQNIGKFLYEEEKRKKHTKSPKVKEIQLHPNIAPNDLTIKIKQTKNFLQENHPVTLKMKFRGRENSHQEIGASVLKSLIQEVQTLTHSDGKIIKSNNSFIIHLQPQKK